ncbi:hypothetical protein [Arsenophonus apicola]|uniref:hypothetical protein n=1 Tax=Arsenophonus apicola TaxID=2879119 RepID=UPI003879538B
MNSAPKKQAKKPKHQKVAKQQPKKSVVKQAVKVKIPKPPIPPKKRLPLAEAVSQISIFWPDLFPEHQLRPMKIGIQQDMWQEVNEKGLQAHFGGSGLYARWTHGLSNGAGPIALEPT